MSKTIGESNPTFIQPYSNKLHKFYVIFQAYSDWVTYTLSGVTSAIYHSCNAGGWCALSYDSLQVCV